MEKNIDFDSWAEELQNSKGDLIEILQQHMNLIEEQDKLKKSLSSKEVESIKQSVDYLLEADLREENGWNKEEINILRKVSENDFEVMWK